MKPSQVLVLKIKLDENLYGENMKYYYNNFEEYLLIEITIPIKFNISVSQKFTYA